MQAYYDTIINMRRSQLEEMRQMVLARAAGLMTTAEDENNIEVNTTLEEEEEEEEEEVTSSRARRQQPRGGRPRPKTANSNNSASTGGRTRRVSIVETRSKTCSTDSSAEEPQQNQPTISRDRGRLGSGVPAPTGPQGDTSSQSLR